MLSEVYFGQKPLKCSLTSLFILAVAETCISMQFGLTFDMGIKLDRVCINLQNDNIWAFHRA